MANDAGPEAKQWAVAAAAILNTMTRHQPRHDCLGGAPKEAGPEKTAKVVLTNSWGIDSREQLIATLEGLATGGHTRDYLQAAAAYQQAPPQQRAQDPNLAFVNQFGQEIGARGLMAWDLGRMVAVAGWGYLANYCTEEEAWNACLSAGVRLRQTYTSWDEYGRHYRLGLLFWDAGAAGQLDQLLGQLQVPNSPWKTVPWSLDGAGAGAMPGFPQAGPPGMVAPSGYGPPPGGQPGAPVPPAAPGYGPPPGQPGAVSSYGGVPVIAPPPGGAGPYPPGAGMPGAPGAGKGKGLILAVVGGGGLLFLIIVVAAFMHFRHKAAEEAHDTPHEAPHDQGKGHDGKHGKH